MHKMEGSSPLSALLPPSFWVSSILTPFSESFVCLEILSLRLLLLHRGVSALPLPASPTHTSCCSLTNAKSHPSSH